jgi:hypothetical protein
LVLLHPVSLLYKPLQDLALGDPFADVRKFELVGQDD